MARRQRQQGKSDQQNVENRYMRQYYTNIASQRRRNLGTVWGSGSLHLHVTRLCN